MEATVILLCTQCPSIERRLIYVEYQRSQATVISFCRKVDYFDCRPRQGEYHFQYANENYDKSLLSYDRLSAAGA